MKRYFITGTDTDCGKTYVTCQLIKWLLSQQYQALGIKPVATGLSTDTGLLEQYNPVKGIHISPWSFDLPVSPHLASKSSLKIQDIADFCFLTHTSRALTPRDDEVCYKSNVLLIEGAGGLMVPLNQGETWLDFLKLTQIPVVLVVGIKLGCINHALLTDMALLSNNMACAGWIANILDDKLLLLDDVIATLKNKMQSPFLGRVDFGGEFKPNFESIP